MAPLAHAGVSVVHHGVRVDMLCGDFVSTTAVYARFSAHRLVRELIACLPYDVSARTYRSLPGSSLDFKRRKIGTESCRSSSGNCRAI